jgi:hypothetical protein
MNHLVNHRVPGEKFTAYRARLRAVAKAIKQRLKGKLFFESSRIVSLPVVGIDKEADKLVIEGKFRDPQVVIAPPPRLPWPHGPRESASAPKEIRLARTKGESYTTTPYINGTKRTQRSLLREFDRIAA